METTRTDERTAAARDQSLDCARGIAIVAIVIGHVERGLAAAGVLDLGPALTIDRLLYLFHLATFAYLSGLFVRRAMERDGARRTVGRRLLLFGWLYLLWTLAQGSVRVAASSLANTPVTVADVLRLWVPEGQLWFLPWLVAVTAVAALAQPWRSVPRATVVLGLSAVLALAVWGFDPVYAFTRGWALLLPFLLGCVVTAPGHARWFGAGGRGVALVAAVAACLWLWVGLGTSAVPPTTGGSGRTVVTVAWGVLGCVAGTVAALAAAALVARSALAAPVAALGRHSLEIFLAHIVVASGTRIVLLQLGVTDVLVHLVGGTLLGLLVPLALVRLTERWGWTWVFGLPGRRPDRVPGQVRG